MQSYLNFHALQVVCRYNFKRVKGGGGPSVEDPGLEKKEGRRGFGGSLPRFFGIFRLILKEKRGGREPPATSSGSAPDPGPVVKTACLESRRSRVRTTLWPSSFKDTICFSRSIVKIQNYGEPLWPRSSVLGLRPPGLKFRILCLECSVILPSLKGSPGPI